MKTSGTPPNPRGYHSCTLIDDKMYVYGGSNGTQCFSDVSCLDLGLKSRKWII